MLAHLLQRRGVGARTLPRDAVAGRNLARLEREGVALICLSYVNPGATQHAQRIVRRLRQHFGAEVRIMVGMWTAEPAAEARAGAARGDRRRSAGHLARPGGPPDPGGPSRNRPRCRRRPEVDARTYRGMRRRAGRAAGRSGAQQPLGLGQILGPVGVEERVERLGREIDLRQPVARSPDVDLADAPRRPSRAADRPRGARARGRTPGGCGRWRRRRRGRRRRLARPQPGHQIARERTACRSRSSRSRGSPAGWRAPIPCRSARRRAGRQNPRPRRPRPAARTAANRAGSPLALSTSAAPAAAPARSHARGSVRSPSRRRLLSPPPMRLACPPASSTPTTAGR